MTAKEFLLKIKAAFDFPAPPAPAPAPAPAVPVTPTATTYKLLDGTEITINQAGALPAAGDAVTIGGVPAPANTYTLADGATIVVDANGMIATYTAMAAPPPAPPVPVPAPAPAVPVTLSAEEFAAMVAKFAIGSTEERLTNAEIMLKALMECNFGYEIRKGQEATAIETYKDSLANMQIAVDAAKAEMKTAFEKVEAQQLVITKHETTIKDLFELAQLLVDAPSVEPVTLTDAQKAKFDRQTEKDKRLQKMAEALKNQKALA